MKRKLPLSDKPGEKILGDIAKRYGVSYETVG
jgi:hypothetical protein